MERLRDEPLHEENATPKQEASDQLGCRLKDESTTPPYQRRPRMASGNSAVLWPQTAASPSVRQEQSHGWGAAPGIAAGQTIPGSCASALTFSSARAGSPRACSFFVSAPTARRLKPPLQIG